MKTLLPRLVWGLVLILVASGIGVFAARARDFHYQEEFRVAFEDTARKNRRAVFEEVYNKLGADRIMEVLEKEYPLCHDQAHDLGRVVFSKTRDIAESIRICKDGCTGACFHGVLMEAFGGVKSQVSGVKTDSEEHVELSEINTKAAELCDDPAILVYHRKGKCVHGLGHAFTYLSEYEIPKALEGCQIFNDRRLEFYCAGGVFMEYEGVHGSRDLASEPLHFPCDRYAGDFPAACYPHKVPHLLKKLGSKENLIQECLKLEGFYKTACFHGLGYQYNSKVEANPVRVKSICRDGTLADQKACLYGAIIKIAEINPEKEAEICEFLSGEKKEFCETTFRQGPYSLERDFSLFMK